VVWCCGVLGVGFGGWGGWVFFLGLFWLAGGAGWLGFFVSGRVLVDAPSDGRHRSFLSAAFRVFDEPCRRFVSYSLAFLLRHFLFFFLALFSLVLDPLATSLHGFVFFPFPLIPNPCPSLEGIFFSWELVDVCPPLPKVVFLPPHPRLFQTMSKDEGRQTSRTSVFWALRLWALPESCMRSSDS